jgi:hypothetical protein
MFFYVLSNGATMKLRLRRTLVRSERYVANLRDSIVKGTLKKMFAKKAMVRVIRAPNNPNNNWFVKTRTVVLRTV